MKNTTKAIFLSLNNLILSIPDNELGKLLQSFSLDKRKGEVFQNSSEHS